MSKHKHKSSVKTLIITDDEEAEGDDLNPFSFKEFLRCKTQTDTQEDMETAHKRASSPNFDAEVKSSFFADPSLLPQEEWGQSYQQEEDSSASLWLEDEEEEVTRFSSGISKISLNGEHYEGDDETSIESPDTSSMSNNQLQQLKEDNVCLKITLKDLQKKYDSGQHRIRQLSEELLQRTLQEEKEAQALESMVQSVEQNLQLMTKRAVKAENSVSRLKQDLQQLQVQCEMLRSENAALKTEESETVSNMRHNAQLASEQLNQAVFNAHKSIKQLLGESDRLRLTSQMLQSIDKISIHTDP